MKSKNKYVIAGVLLVLILLAGIIVTVIKTNEKEDTEGNAENSIPGYEVYERVDAPYEHWLAAAVISGISTEYPDFILEQILVKEETTLADYENSSGIYVIFTAEGEQKCIYSVPIDSERTESGTTDVMSTVIGYATFDFVSLQELDMSEFREMEVDDLNTLIEQSELVTIYSR